MGSVAERPPRVLVVGQGPPTRGGIPTFITELATDPWLARKVQFEVLNTTPRTTKRPGALSPANVRLALTHASAVWRRARRTDVVHLNLAPAPTFPLLRAILLSAAAKAARSRVMLHAHSGRIERCAESRTYRRLLRLASRVVDEFIVVSRPAERVVAEARNRVIYLPNGIDVDRFSTGPKPTEPPHLAFVGTICERKGLVDLLQALKALPQGPGEARLPVRVVLVGDSAQEGPDEFDRVRRAYVDAGLSEVQFCGPVDRQRIVEILARSSIFCLPSHWEGFPLSVLEAMASGAAVVATSVGEIPSMLDHGRAGILTPVHDPAALATAIKRLIDDPEERARLGDAARRRVRELYGRRRMASCLYDTYSRLRDHSM